MITRTNLWDSTFNGGESQHLGAGSPFGGSGSQVRGGGSQIGGAGAEIRPNLTPEQPTSQQPVY